MRVILIDVDGTLAGIYRGGRRPLRPGARAALERLAAVADVYLWSVAGRENADRLLREYPELAPHVRGTFEKDEAVLEQFDDAYCIDDEEIDEAVLRCHRAIVSPYDAGDEEDGLLWRAADFLIESIRDARLPRDRGHD